MPGWKLAWEGSIKEFPDLTERVWVTERPPGGCYNYIALREVRGKNVTYPHPVLILPGMTSHGEQLIHVSWHGIQPIEPAIPDSMIPIYLARQGYLVYTIDYRTHFVLPDVKDLSFMVDWGWDAWLSDIRETINMIKEITGKDKVVLIGESFGGIASMNYVTAYPNDVRAIVLLDGVPIRSSVLQALPIRSIEELRSSKLYAVPSILTGAKYPGSIMNTVWLKALYNPTLPSPEPGFRTLSDYLMNIAYNQGLANPYSYPNSPPQAIFAVMATLDPYWPTRLFIEPMDQFRAKYTEVKVPILAVISGLFGMRAADIDLMRRLTSDIIILDGYGHLDVYANPNNVKDVNEPVHNWLVRVKD
ncbi:alpha/beta hydrolase [Vulcanisaeta distributa]|uniref:Alpha/beta hydrolase fold protein n=1 Tax=Vulcanisaeta distributa (strain DSM 14429 / JCM 11212 / NBRC 100878 / IC-017) TaxID=572478 RepID=E1QTQ9_VULDI|nr:alpha/beta fold hydrolase [Vulcanisaeta distributa]ADN50976.1 alpha/beta hydrolase fold protein [Vulcanisaeta distributa DSM 14429]